MENEYKIWLTERGFKADEQQLSAMEILSQYRKPRKYFSKFFKGSEKKGVYIYGSVGTGKTTVMDFFFSQAEHKAKQRIHCSDLLQDINKIIIEGKQLGYKDPIKYVIKKYKSIKLLCIDELEILDVAASIILRRLLMHLLSLGCRIICTSNTEPQNLYKDGLQRDRFNILIQMILANFHLVQLDSGFDYRKFKLITGEYLKHHKIIEISDPEEGHIALMRILAAKCADFTIPQESSIKIYGREVAFSYYKKTVILSFAKFCAGMYHYNDYRQIIKLFKTVIITEIPQINNENLDIWRRFVMLIDAIYDSGKELYCTAYFNLMSCKAYEIKGHVPQIERAISRLFEVK